MNPNEQVNNQEQQPDAVVPEVNAEVTQEPPKSAPPKKELTPQQLQKRKKMIVFPLLFLLFAGVMWLIYAPSGEAKEEQREGFNTELPNPKESGIVSDKRDAYQQEAMQEKQQEKMRSLQDFAFALDGNEATEERVVLKPAEYYEEDRKSTRLNSSH